MTLSPAPFYGLSRAFFSEVSIPWHMFFFLGLGLGLTSPNQSLRANLGRVAGQIGDRASMR